MGILSDTIVAIQDEIETEEINYPAEFVIEINDYVSTKSTDKEKGTEIILKILRHVIKEKQSEINLLKIANGTTNTVSKGIEDLKDLLKPEKKPFQRDKRKYSLQYWLFFSLTIITVITLIFLLILPLHYKNWLDTAISTQIIYRTSVLLPFSAIIALLIYQYRNALKHYHKACESIHIMGSYPAIINAICVNQDQKEKACARLFDVLFDWHPRPNEWSMKKQNTLMLKTLIKEVHNIKQHQKTE
ncbi:hypothetical protein KORDIASMS9_04663 [Kordia sp. SMS9]|uniref:hypothetical protein n=1 Tax=Kordia sp. SMS9 TaxID=2282170 RepID=UPI000E0D2D61|nr:hypothetical protein [Kordia sp. SMS9]AXG72391.1 hypothetical protein KORDIASMS9_04663 [Kordia sp. SMS9]